MAIAETKVQPQPWPSCCSAATQKGKGSRGSFKLLRQRLQQRKTTITLQD